MALGLLLLQSPDLDMKVPGGGGESNARGSHADLSNPASRNKLPFFTEPLFWSIPYLSRPPVFVSDHVSGVRLGEEVPGVDGGVVAGAVQQAAGDGKAGGNDGASDVEPIGKADLHGARSLIALAPRHDCFDADAALEMLSQEQRLPMRFQLITDSF